MTALDTPRAIERLRASDELATATQGRRLAAQVIDLLAFWFTLGIGWLIWFAIVASRAQSPAKQLLGLYVVRTDGTLADAGHMWLREVLVKWLLFGLLSVFAAFFTPLPTLLPVWAIAALWCVWDRDRQCLWDKIVATYVGHAAGERPARDPDPAFATSLMPSDDWGETPDVVDQLRALKAQLDAGTVTEHEYRARRQALVDKL